MPGRMAENDDEDGFGDFKFASSNGPVAVSADDDNDWGEFTKLRFNPAGSLPEENSNLVVNGSSTAQSLSGHGLKPNGAIPLYFFGEVETEEAGSDVVGNLFETGVISGSKKVNCEKVSAPDLNHLIGNLYVEKDKSKGENGSFTGSPLNNPKNSVDNQANSMLNGQIGTLPELDVSLNVSSDASFRSEGSDSLWAGFRSISNKDTSVEVPEKDKFSCLPPNGFRSNENGFVPEGSKDNLAHPSLEDDQDDDDGWEFKDAGFAANQGEESKIQNDLTFAFSFPDPSWREPDSYANELVSNSNWAVPKENRLSFTPVEKNEESCDDDGWEFKAVKLGNNPHNNGTKGEESKNQNDLTFAFSFPDPSWREPDSYANELVSKSNWAVPKEKRLSFTQAEKKEESCDDDDDGWEFKAAESGNSQHNNGTKVVAMGWDNSRGSGNLSGFIDNFSPDLASTPGQIAVQPDEWGFGFGVVSSSPFKNGAVDMGTAVSFSDDKNVKCGPDKISSPLENIFSENESEDANQTNEKAHVKHKGALPLSIFGDKNLENDPPLDFPDVPKKPTFAKPDTKDPASNVSISDIISILYHQQEPSSVNYVLNSIEDGHSENGFGPGGNAIVSDIVDDFDDCSWEFKDAVSEQISQNQILQVSTESNINDLKDFYSKLKADLCLILLSHLKSIKETQGYSAYEDSELKALEKEIQDLCKDRCRDLKVSQENASQEKPLNNFSVNKFYTALKEEKFQLLEAEYRLSEQLSQVEKDVKSAFGLLKHVTSTLEILKLGSSEEQSLYVCTWSNILSACVRELKHGAFIWKQSLQKNISSQMLSDPLGKQYIIALGEIFRVVKVLRRSVELYKPWILSSSDSSHILDLLEECFTLWSSSGIKEALKTLSDPSITNFDGTIKDLLQFINCEYDIDPHKLYDQICSGKLPTCHLSGLPLDKIPGMNVVAWNGEDYFLKLANLWANLISRDPPNLPRILANRRSST